MEVKEKKQLHDMRNRGIKKWLKNGMRGERVQDTEKDTNLSIRV